MKKPEGYDEIVLAEDKKDIIRKLLPDYVETLTESASNRGFYKCLFCDSGHKSGIDPETGKKHTGAFSISTDKKKWHCWSCQRAGDIFDLIGYQMGIVSAEDLKTTAKRPSKQARAELFRQEYEKAQEIFKDKLEQLGSGSEAEDTGAQPAAEAVEEIGGIITHTVPAAEEDTAAEGTFSEYLVKCAEALAGSKGYEYLISRGISPETMQHFLLGYDADKKAITIPYDKDYSYYATRSIEGKEFNKPSREASGIPEPVYNALALRGEKYCFICESQLDAISLYQASAGSITAVALGGTGSGKLLTTLKEFSPQHCLILSLDNDAAGREAQSNIAEALTDAGIDYIEARYSLDKYPDPAKDANDLLRGDPEQLADDIKQICTAARAQEMEHSSALFTVGEYLSAGLFKAHQTAEQKRISTGYASLDRALYGGFMSSEMYVLSADTSMGKSAICSCIAQNVAQQGIPVLYYCLEMGRDEFIARGASMISREKNINPIPYAEILNYKWDDDLQDFSKRPYSDYEPYVKEYLQRYGQYLYFIEGGLHGRTAAEIAQTAEAFKKEHHCKQLMIVVDYLQRLVGDPEDRSQRDLMSIVSAAVMTLSNLATQKHNTVLAISSISNAQKGSTVTDAAGKYSGDVGYSAGVMLGWNWIGYSDTKKDEDREATKQLCKERGYREMKLEVLKQRSGDKDASRTLFYYPAYNYITAPNITGKIQPHKGGKK